MRIKWIAEGTADSLKSTGHSGETAQQFQVPRDGASISETGWSVCQARILSTAGINSMD